LSALKGRRDPAPLQGAKRSVDDVTQGVALGWHPPALSAPEDIGLFFTSQGSQSSRLRKSSHANSALLALHEHFWGII